MNELIALWLSEQGLGDKYIASATVAIGVGIIFVVASLSYYLAKHQVLAIVNKVILRSKNTWDDALIEHGVLNRFTLLLPLILILF